jgi:spectinomycin phosphotransferase
MREDPGLDTGRIVACLDAQYGLQVASVTFLPIGYDLNAAPFEAVTADGTSYFLKIRFGPVHEPGLLLPSALIENGIPSIVAPFPTRSSDLWCSLDGYPGYSVVLFPFIRGENAKVAGLSDAQWRTFGSTLRAVHDSGLGKRFCDLLPVETFSLPSAAKVRSLLPILDGARFESPAATDLAAFWVENAGRIRHVLARAEELGSRLRMASFELVVCHGDIHLANVLVGADGRIFLIDWEGPPYPLIAPRERDLLFVAGSRIGRRVEPREQDRFFDGYGPVAIDPTALIFYRYERIIQDIGEIGETVFMDPRPGEAARAREAELAKSFFDQRGAVELAEEVP